MKRKEVPFRLESMDRFRVVGFRIHTTNQKREGKKTIPTFWQTLLSSDAIKKLFPLMNQKPGGIMGLSVYNTDPSNARAFDYYVGCASDYQLVDEMVAYEVPAALWAVFSCKKEKMGKIQVQAIMKWLPKFGYRPLNSGYLTGKMKSVVPDMEVYLANDDVEIWVAVEEK